MPVCVSASRWECLGSSVKVYWTVAGVRLSEMTNFTSFTASLNTHNTAHLNWTNACSQKSEYIVLRWVWNVWPTACPEIVTDIGVYLWDVLSTIIIVTITVPFTTQVYYLIRALIRWCDDLPAKITHVPVAAVPVLNTPDDGGLRPKHVAWLCRNKTCTVLHQVGFYLTCTMMHENKIKICTGCSWNRRPCVRYVLYGSEQRENGPSMWVFILTNFHGSMNSFLLPGYLFLCLYF